MAAEDVVRTLALIVGLPALLLAACGGGDAEPAATELATAAPPATDTAPLASAVNIPNTEPALHIELPDGFTAYAVAGEFLRPTSLALAPDGSVYVTERHGNVFHLVDADGDGLFDDRVLFASDLLEVTGSLVAPDGGLYVSDRGRLVLAHDTDGDRVADRQQEIVTDIPVGLHQNNGLALGPDGKLYLTSGSPCDDACGPTSDLHAAILQVDPDGANLRQYARGLRNPYDLVFDSQGRLWATDNGSDRPCETVDELNLIVEGGDYGWPYADDGCDPFTDGIPPVTDLGMHTASTGIDFYDGAHFPPEYEGNLFVTLWGSFEFEPVPYGPSLLRIIVTDGDDPTAEVERFGAGFTHPIAVAADTDGTLLVLDYGSDDPDEATGTLYRIVYTG